MYEAFYGLKTRPFAKTPDPRFLFMSRAHEEALARLHFAVEEREIVLLNGRDRLRQDNIFDHLLGKLAEVLDGFCYVFLSVVGPYVHVVEMADDYGTNAGPMFNPKVYTKFFMPRYKKSIEMIKRKAPQAKVMLHNDGAIRKFIPDLIETGFDILNPIEGYLRGMDPVELKRDFGRDLTFQGGVDVKTVLNNGTVDDVRREVRLRIEQMGEGDGYILAPAHNFSNDIPLENMLAFFEAGQELGKYPLK